MKNFLSIAAIFICSYAMAQDSSIVKKQQLDTVRFGGILIIKTRKKNNSNKIDSTISNQNEKGKVVINKTSQRKKNSQISTNWFVLDLGFSNYDDKTNYSNSGNYLINKPGTVAFNNSDFKLNTGKSINVNLWLFMQRMGLIKHYVNLKYGIGIEINNYRYKTSSAISYKEGGAIPYSNNLQTSSPFIFRDSISFLKNKLVADYITVPLMLNFNPNNNKKGIRLSAGISAGYLYSQRNKQKSDARGKQAGKGDYDLERFKLSYIGEIGLGPVLLYGSYAPKSMYSRGLDMKPYTIGVRFSNW